MLFLLTPHAANPRRSSDLKGQMVKEKQTRIRHQPLREEINTELRKAKINPKRTSDVGSGEIAYKPADWSNLKEGSVLSRDIHLPLKSGK